MKDEIKEIINWLNQIIKENKESDVSLNSCVVPFETLYKLQDYITNLQKENEKLKEDIEDISASHFSCFKRYDDYKQRNEKAVEYIKNETEDLANKIDDYAISKYLKRDLLNILQGGDE